MSTHERPVTTALLELIRALRAENHNGELHLRVGRRLYEALVGEFGPMVRGVSGAEDSPEDFCLSGQLHVRLDRCLP